MAEVFDMGDLATFDSDGLVALVAVLLDRGFEVLAPVLRDDTVTYGPIASTAELPAGRGDEQGPAHYRTRPRADDALFGYAAPVQSARAVFFPAEEMLWSSRVVEGAATPVIEPNPVEPGPVAYLGLRSCDLAALVQHDAILIGRGFADEAYARRRRDALLIAVTCADPAGTCFCASLGTGPAPGPGADLALTEIVGDGPHRFVARADTARGADLLEAIGARPADDADRAAASRVERTAADHMGRTLDTDDLVGLLYAAADSPRWAEVAERCLACANCTLVCPTCFCTTITDTADLTGAYAERRRVWASCFTSEHSYIHGGSVRSATASRYRQWLTHKLAAWQDQFDTIGCVGCGRCITWCPAGIDLTAEVAALRHDALQGG